MKLGTILKMNNIVILLLSILVLSGCSGKNAPDEMLVVDGTSLSLPPNFELRPPRGEQNTQSISASETENIVFGNESGESSDDNSEGAVDDWLIKSAGGENRDPDIREKLITTPDDGETPDKWFEKTFGESQNEE